MEPMCQCGHSCFYHEQAPDLAITVWPCSECDCPDMIENLTTPLFDLKDSFDG